MTTLPDARGMTVQLVMPPSTAAQYGSNHGAFGGRPPRGRGRGYRGPWRSQSPTQQHNAAAPPFRDNVGIPSTGHVPDVDVDMPNASVAVTETCCTNVWQRIRRIFWSRRLAVNICAGILFLHYIFSKLTSITRSARVITEMIQKRLDKLGDMILDRVTLKQGKTYCGRWLMLLTCKCGTWIKSAIWLGIHGDTRTSDILVRESSVVIDVYSYYFGLHR